MWDLKGLNIYAGQIEDLGFSFQMWDLKMENFTTFSEVGSGFSFQMWDLKRFKVDLLKSQKLVLAFKCGI